MAVVEAPVRTRRRAIAARVALASGLGAAACGGGNDHVEDARAAVDEDCGVEVGDPIAAVYDDNGNPSFLLFRVGQEFAIGGRAVATRCPDEAMCLPGNFRDLDSSRLYCHLPDLPPGAALEVTAIEADALDAGNLGFDWEPLRDE